MVLRSELWLKLRLRAVHDAARSSPPGCTLARNRKALTAESDVGAGNQFRSSFISDASAS